MKFRRKRTPAGNPAANGVAGPTALTPAFGAPDRVDEVTEGPFDVKDVDLEDGVERIDLGSLLIAPGAGRDVRLQVDQKTQRVQAVLIAGSDGAIELRAFAAPRGGDLWEETRPRIAEDMKKRGASVAEAEGPMGTELRCEVTVKRPDGTPAQQPSRIVGLNGPRWFLRATLLGQPVADEAAAKEWEGVLRGVVVRRGDEAMAVGDPLPITVPEKARRIK
ncbi:DUF3710 domain-containing protein [Nocardioides zeae]|uniref:DUF3710 domain-containing protein n=1 Tax=Nocardioides imazamoxiresistens TaxID=3231893 RepID=A0ABU3PZD0_9ACTN|nr:DUF3710 domain-containing protein [Nocardioides zeae]MDT9594607.1 DUF3710 domain-containing protein [Nocardioides zeae]